MEGQESPIPCIFQFYMHPTLEAKRFDQRMGCVNISKAAEELGLFL